ncbi:MAG: hypothetical protein IJE49_01740 [Agathobacter sp.]|nr:hypothetical protein [Agathobacter sp.]
MLEYKEIQNRFTVVFGPEQEDNTYYMEQMFQKCRQEVDRLVRYVPHGVLLLEQLTGREYLEEVAYQYKIEDTEIIQELAEHFELPLDLQLLDMTYEQNKFVAILGGIISEPKVLLLDRPFEYFTQEESLKLLEILKWIYGKGVAIVIATEHYEDVHDNATFYVYLRDGEMIEQAEEDKGANFVKKLVIKKGDFAEVSRYLGKPVAQGVEGVTYYTDLDWVKVALILREGKVADRDVNILMATKEELLNMKYPAEIKEEEVDDTK